MRDGIGSIFWLQFALMKCRHCITHILGYFLPAQRDLSPSQYFEEYFLLLKRPLYHCFKHLVKGKHHCFGLHLALPLQFIRL